MISIIASNKRYVVNVDILVPRRVAEMLVTIPCERSIDPFHVTKILVPHHEKCQYHAIINSVTTVANDEVVSDKIMKSIDQQFTNIVLSHAVASQSNVSAQL
ncbi:hypothetical protein X798_03648 [Onchocerca flexuosa]|uniref:DZF domain-containing protein n=2 Tax=Onchocerca flexuosa TaxID=387005 RepID=A0A183H0Y0_9BILA|nr:hypothetical protein X798_03648 [Onchocerca flexuosa]VDO28402.1 unnamed protein product [Onchocerca flexuosa]